MELLSKHNISITDMKDIYDDDKLRKFMSFIDTCEWNHNVPGGFLTNSPQRLVNSFGTGATIRDDGTLNNDGWPSTFWTAAIKHSNITIETIPEDVPNGLVSLVPTAKQLFKRHISSARPTSSTFNIAVCNKYCDPSHEIKAHTDCNDWYPEESDVGPVFASITVYPNTKPKTAAEHARFQVKLDGKWVDVVLPHMSIMIMPSNIEHRVMKHKRSTAFHNRINITLRSTYDKKIDPLRSLQAVSNHARYYRIPCACHYPSDCDFKSVLSIVNVFNTYNENHNHGPLKLIESSSTDARRNARRLLIKKLKNGSRYRVNTNTVYETVYLANEYVENNYSHELPDLDLEDDTLDENVFDCHIDTKLSEWETIYLYTSN